jgi:hypothetical protein
MLYPASPQDFNNLKEIVRDIQSKLNKQSPLTLDLFASEDAGLCEVKFLIFNLLKGSL